jgi:hypothetical protein
MARAFARVLGSLATLILLQVGCGAPQSSGGNGNRPELDCTSEVSYQGSRVGGGASVLGLGKASAEREDVALHRIGDAVERYVSAHRRLCQEYNARIVTPDEYKKRSEELQRQVMGVQKGLEAVAAAKTEGERKKLLMPIYLANVPQDARPEELKLEMSLEARLPESLGGALMRVTPNAPLPTNARVNFTFRVSRAAFLYVFQKGPSGAPTVLFPDPRIGQKNPLPAGTLLRIPPGDQSYRLNEQDLGTEQVYLVASAKPLPEVEAGLKRVLDGALKNVAEDKTLGTLATMVPGGAPEGCKTRALELAGPAPACTRSRGLVLDPGKEESSSLAVLTDPGDDAIAKAFPFRHVTEQAYGEAARAYAAPTEAGRKTRGIMLE